LNETLQNNNIDLDSNKGIHDIILKQKIEYDLFNYSKIKSIKDIRREKLEEIKKRLK